MKHLIQEFTSSRGQRVSPAEKTAAHYVLTCMGVQRDESLLIIADPYTLNSTAGALSEAAFDQFQQVKLMLYEGPRINGMEPPRSISEAMVDADVALLITNKSLSHTAARQRACESGTRIASMPGITRAIFTRSLTGDQYLIAQRSKQMAEKLTNGNNVRVQSEAGTDLTLSITNRDGIADTGNLQTRGAFGNLPAGEAFIAPVEYSAEGILVVDGCFANIPIDKPITIQIQQGSISKISGNKAAQLLQRQLSALPPSAKLVCEFGIGTNPAAILSPKILESEKTYGTCHIAFGRNNTFGGIIDVPYHADGVIKDPTIYVDSIPIIRCGQFV